MSPTCKVRFSAPQTEDLLSDEERAGAAEGGGRERDFNNKPAAVDYARQNGIDPTAVVGTHERGPLRNLMLGNVAERGGAKTAPCPVLT